jgi:hypothetical protein
MMAMSLDELLTWQVLFAALGFIALVLAILAEPARKSVPVKRLEKTVKQRKGQHDNKKTVSIGRRAGRANVRQAGKNRKRR